MSSGFYTHMYVYMYIHACTTYTQYTHKEKNTTVCSSCLPEVLLLTTTLTSDINLQTWDAPLFFYHTVISQHWYWNLLKPVFQLLLFFERTYYHMALNSRSFCLVPSTGIAVLGPGHFNLAFLKAMGLLLYSQFCTLRLWVTDKFSVCNKSHGFHLYTNFLRYI